MSQPKRITRNRTGCFSCKARRRRCTEERPSCQACNAKGLKCEYGIRLLWEDAAREAGIAFGRVGMKDRFTKNKSKEGKEKGKGEGYHLIPVERREGEWLWFNVRSRDLELFCGEYGKNGEAEEDAGGMEMTMFDEDKGAELLLDWSTQTPSRPLREYPCLDQNSSLILDYYVQELCHRKVLVDGNQNPFRHLILPLCSSSPPLLHAVIAVSANDLRNRQDVFTNPQFSQKLLYHKSKSLGALRQSFASFSNHSADQPDDMASRDAMLLTVLMHCYLEIASGSHHEWIAHLKGAKSVIQYYQDQNQNTPSNLLFSTATLQFVHDYFSVRDIFSSTAINEDTRQWTLQPIPSPQDSHHRTKINVDLGLSEELLDIISSITSLARLKNRLRRTKTTNPAEESSFLSTANSLQTRLDNLHQWSPELESSSTSLPDSNHHLLYKNAAAFKSATYIYLRHAAFDDAPSSPNIQSHHLPELLSLLHQIHEDQGEKLGRLPYPMWALFMAGCVVGEDERTGMLGLWVDLRERRPVSSVPTAMRALEAVWKVRDLEVEKKGKRTGLVWEEALGVLGWKMSLT